MRPPTVRCGTLRAMPRRKRLALTLYATLALVTTGTVFGLWAFDVFRGSDLETVDARFEVRGEHAAPDVVLVAIDTDSITRDSGALPVQPRCTTRDVIRQLTKAGAG